MQLRGHDGDITAFAISVSAWADGWAVRKGWVFSPLVVHTSKAVQLWTNPFLFLSINSTANSTLEAC